jgi:[protein-PII] uridylyltransferase
MEVEQHERTGRASRGTPPISADDPVLRPVLRAAFEHHQASLVERLEAGEDGVALGRANARFLTVCFQCLFERAMRHAGLPSGIALAAVGSFGRGAVALRSDADVVLIVDTEAVGAGETTVCAEALLHPLWDAGVAVDHQVLSCAEVVPLAEGYLETATAVLDLRLLAGDPELLRTLDARAYQGLFGEHRLGAFIDRLEAETTARHLRFGGSVYLLEPDLKNGAGALRDLDGMRWAARARYRIGHETVGKVRNAWRELVELGVLVAPEAQQIAEAEEFLWRARNRLHLRAERKADRLAFEDQEALAVSMGYGDDRARAAERLMQAFYLYARTVTRARSSLFERLRPERRRTKPGVTTVLDGGVQMFDGKITIGGASEIQKDPAVAMRAFAVCVRRRAPMLPFARDIISGAAADAVWCERLRFDPEAADLFVDLVCTVPEVRAPRGSIVGDLHEAGLLLAMLPEFRPVTGRPHHDVYHAYTVDVHSVAAVDRLRQLARGELALEYPLASRLAAEIARPRALFLATLLHDIGKGYPDASGSRKNHSNVGAELCERILPRLRVSSEDAEEAGQLVRNHLLMYHVAMHRDLEESATIAEFCRSLRGREGLRNLYLLTMADVTTTSPTAMTSWKARMLEDLYFASEAYLSGQSVPADAQRVARVVEAVRVAWSGPTKGLDALLASLPERYFFANHPESIVHHARAVSARAAGAGHVVRVPSRHPEAAELCIMGDDRPGLLASITATLTANQLEVLSAEVYSHPVGAEREAFDLFWVRDRDGGTEGVALALPRLERDLQDVCSGRVTGSELLRSRTGSLSPWRERPSPEVRTEILFDNRASPYHTIVEVYAKDRRGLLHRVARTLYELRLSITLSKINTEGTRVADVFYVSELDGSKVAPGARHQEIHDALVLAVNE